MRGLRHRSVCRSTCYYFNFNNRFRIRIVLVAICGFSILSLGCSHHDSNISLSNQELRENTVIYLGDTQYRITEDLEGPAALEPATSKSQTASKPVPHKATTPRSTPQPIDINYVLTKVKDISVGLVSEVDGSREQNESTRFTPASITKVITTSVALKTLGPNFRYETKLSLKKEGSIGKDLIIVADGDPTVGVTAYAAGSPRRLTQMADEIKSMGIASLAGSITALSRFPELDRVRYAQGIPDEDLKECYGAMSAGFNYKSNCMSISAHPLTGFRWGLAGVDSLLEGVLETSGSTKNALRLNPILSPERFLTGFLLAGVYSRENPKVVGRRLPIGSAAPWFLSDFIKELHRQKILVGSEVKRIVVSNETQRKSALEVLADDSRAVRVFYSESLSKIVEATNKPSDNFFADSLFKAVGVRFGDRRHAGESSSLDALSLGQAVIESSLYEWLLRDGHTDWQSELKFYDGAGLSKDNWSTPRAFMAVLRQLPHESFFEELWNSLPIGGEDGTLAGRMGNTAADGKVRAKTGTLSGSYQLIGYIPKQNGAGVDYIPFVILTSASASRQRMVMRFQDAVIDKMAAAVAAGKAVHL